MDDQADRFAYAAADTTSLPTINRATLALALDAEEPTQPGPWPN